MAAPMKRLGSVPFFVYQRLGLSESVSRSRHLSDTANDADAKKEEFDERILKYVACPLSKRPLRYDKKNNELICDEIGVAYSIVNGIPNLIPQDARMLDKKDGIRDEIQYEKKE